MLRYERKRAEYIEKLPSGKHSCMGIGRTQPDPAGSLTLKDKVEVPFGKPVSSNTSDTTLLYNEYPFLWLIVLLYEICVFLNIY